MLKKAFYNVKIEKWKVKVVSALQWLASPWILLWNEWMNAIESIFSTLVLLPPQFLTLFGPFSGNFLIWPVSLIPWLLNWIIFLIESSDLFWNWITVCIEFWAINIESNIKLNHFLAKFKHWIESNRLSPRAIPKAVFKVLRNTYPGKTWCQILFSIRLKCVSKILTPCRMLKKCLLIAKIIRWNNSFQNMYDML